MRKLFALLTLVVFVLVPHLAMSANPAIIFGSGGKAKVLTPNGIETKSGIEILDNTTDLTISAPTTVVEVQSGGGGGGPEDLVLSGVGLEDGTYTLIVGKYLTIADNLFDYDVSTNNLYNMYYKDNSGTYNYVMYNTTDSQWVVFLSGTPPASVVNGYTFNSGEPFSETVLVATSETKDTRNSPDSTAPTLSYVGGGGGGASGVALTVKGGTKIVDHTTPEAPLFSILSNDELTTYFGIDSTVALIGVDTSINGSLAVAGPEEILFPNGSLLQRPGIAFSGSTRFNTDLGYMETYEVDRWRRLTEENYKNYIRNPYIDGDATAIPTLWTKYANTTPGPIPDDFGGSPSGPAQFDLDVITSDPLRGRASLGFTRQIAIEGDGAYIGFTLDKADLAQVLTFSADVSEAAGDYNEDLGVFLVCSNDAFVADFKVLHPMDTDTAEISSGMFVKQIQTDATRKDCRLTLHVVNNSATQFALDLDAITLNRRVNARTAIITDSNKYTPTFAGLGTVTDHEIYYRQVGDHLEVQGRFLTGSTTAVTAELHLPNGLEIDTDKLDNNTAVGHFWRNPNTTSSYSAVFASLTDRIYIANNASGALTPVNGNAFAGVSENISVKFSVPIKGWSASGATTSSLGNRDINVYARSNSNDSIANGGRVPFTSIIKDTAGNFDGLRFTAKERGTYTFDGSAMRSTAGAFEIVARRNSSTAAGDQFNMGYVLNSSQIIMKLGAEIDLEAGDYIDFIHLGGGTLTLSSNAVYHYMKISKKAPAQTKYETPTQSVRSTNSSGQSMPNGGAYQVVDFQTIDNNTMGEITCTPAGCTVTKNGWYGYSALLSISIGGSSGTMNLGMQKNGTLFNVSYKYGEAAESTVSNKDSGSIYLVEGDLIAVSLSQNTGAARNLVADPNSNVFSLWRIK